MYNANSKKTAQLKKNLVKPIVKSQKSDYTDNASNASTSIKHNNLIIITTNPCSNNNIQNT